MSQDDPNTNQPNNRISSLNLNKPSDNTNSNHSATFTDTPHAIDSDHQLIDPPELRQFTMIIYIMYMVGLFTGIASLVGVIMAYVKRDEAEGTIYADHYTFLIRTFWISLVASVIGIITSPILIGFVILMALCVWYIYRCVVGFIKFNDRKPIDPMSWF